jgi:hypothetical protein
MFISVNMQKTLIHNENNVLWRIIRNNINPLVNGIVFLFVLVSLLSY